MSQGEVTFSSRLMELLGGRYSPAMRRSIQTVVLYEADRCLRERYSALRLFQRKIALYDAASDIINTLVFIPPYHRIEIMFRTASGKVPLSPDLAWRRMKLIDREIQKTIVPKIRPFLDPERGHRECCNDFIQAQYEAVSGVKGRNHPSVWEYSHLSIFLAYRMFYLGEDVSSSLPPARDPNPHRVVPNKKPAFYPPEPRHVGRCSGGYDTDDGSGGAGQNGAHHSRLGQGNQPTMRKRRKGGGIANDPDSRRALLKEVRDHLEILKEFEGIVPTEELERRKKELFLSLPPTPTTMSVGAAMPGLMKKRTTAAAKDAMGGLRSGGSNREGEGSLSKRAKMDVDVKEEEDDVESIEGGTEVEDEGIDDDLEKEMDESEMAHEVV